MSDATLLILGVIITILLVILGIIILLKRLKVRTGITNMTVPATTIQEDHFFREGNIDRVGVNYFSIKGKGWVVEVHDPIGSQFKIGQSIRVLFSGLSIIPETKLKVDSNVVDIGSELDEAEKIFESEPKKPKRPRPKKKVKRK